jgi:rfaE bifunctional protein nucleotidyltransferase chain/domain
MRSREKKIWTVEDASEVRDKCEAAGEKLVFTNGCFDLLHLGHIDYLERARLTGDRFVLALNSDRSVKELKGDLRPVVEEDARAGIMAALECIDGVLIFDTLRVDEILRTIRPHIYVKGGDYNPETLHAGEREAAQEVGAEIVILPFLEGYSTTSLIDRIKRL